MNFRTACALPLLFLAGPALPQETGDSTLGLRTNGLSIARGLDLSFDEEKLFVSPHEVRADYVIRNETDKPVETDVFFVMPDVQGPIVNTDAGSPSAENFLDYYVMLDGKAVTPALQRHVYSHGIDMTDVVTAAKVALNPLSEEAHKAVNALPAATIDEWIARGLLAVDMAAGGEDGKLVYAPAWTLKSGYIWRTTFLPGKPVRISERFVPSIGSTVALPFLEDGQPKGEAFKSYDKTYCLSKELIAAAQKSLADESGASAYYTNFLSYALSDNPETMGTIKTFSLKVDSGDAANVVSFCGDGVRKTGPTSYEMTATDYDAAKGLDILMLVPAQAP